MTKVHILATCRKPELLRATTLVFDTIRTGFPTAKIEVDWNGSDSSREMEITGEAATKVGASFVAIKHTTHHEWLCSILKHQDELCWVADSDLVFWNDVESFDLECRMAGRLTPRFACNFTKSITQSRLHTSLLRIDPLQIRGAIEIYGSYFPDCYATPRPTIEDLVSPRYIPDRNGPAYFYDTASLLYQAIGGYSFDEDTLNRYDHVGSGTLSDVVAPHYPEYRMRETHFAIFENPQLAKGSWKLQDEFYAKHAC